MESRLINAASARQLGKRRWRWSLCLAWAALVHCSQILGQALVGTPSFGLPGLAVGMSFEQARAHMEARGLRDISTDPNVAVFQYAFGGKERQLALGRMGGGDAIYVGVSLHDVPPAEVQQQRGIWLAQLREAYGESVSAESGDKASSVGFCHSPWVGVQLITGTNDSGVAVRYVASSTGFHVCAGKRTTTTMQPLLTELRWANSGPRVVQALPAIQASLGNEGQLGRHIVCQVNFRALAEAGVVSGDRSAVSALEGALYRYAFAVWMPSYPELASDKALAARAVASIDATFDRVRAELKTIGASDFARQRVFPADCKQRQVELIAFIKDGRTTLNPQQDVGYSRLLMCATSTTVISEISRDPKRLQEGRELQARLKARGAELGLQSEQVQRDVQAAEQQHREKARTGGAQYLGEQLAECWQWGLTSRDGATR